MTRRILLVDGSPVAYQAFHSTGKFTTKAGEPSGLQYGFLRAIRSYREEFQCQKALIVWDSKTIIKAEGRDYFKANRPLTKEKQMMYDQLPKLKELVGWTCYSQTEKEGWEADDLLYSISRDLNEQGVEVILVTADRDLFAAVNKLTRVFLSGQPNSGNAGKRILVDETAVKEHFGVYPECVPYLKAILGDSSDNIPKIPQAPGEELVKLTLNRLAESNALNWGQVTLALPAASCKEAADNFELTQMRRVLDVVVKKGDPNPNRLEAEFVRLEFKSMMKYLKDYLA